MPTLRHWLVGISAFALLSCSGGGKDDAASTPGFFAHDSSDLAADPAVVYGRLENGLRYAVLANQTPTETAALQMRFDTGSLNEADDEKGIAHFLEHMAFNGSANIPEGELVKRLERYGLAFGADTNAFTSFDQTVYTLALPNVSEDLIDESLLIMREIAENLTLDADAIDRERGVIKSEKRGRDSAAYRAQIHNLEFFLKGSRIPARLPIGETQTIESVNAEQFREFYEGHYRPEETFIVMVGDFDTAAIEAKIEAQFGDWAARGTALDDIEPGTTQIEPGAIGFFSDPEITTSVTLATLRPFQAKPDTVETRRESLLDSFGSSILNRRFAALARKGDAVFLSAGGSVSSLLDTAEMAAVTVNSQPERWRGAMAIAEQEVRKALKFGFTQAELDEQLANLRKNLEIGVQTAPTRRTGGLASGLMGSFASDRVFTHPESGLERFTAYESEITVEDVWARFKEQWQGIDDPVIYLSTNADIPDYETVIRAAYDDSAAKPVTANEAEVTAAFAYTDFGQPGKVASRTHIDEIDTHVVVFENGVRLNVKQTDFSKDVVSIRVGFGDGFLSLPKDNPSLQMLAPTVMNDGGLVEHSNDELQRILAGKAVSANFSVGAQRFLLSGGTVPSDFTDQMNVLAASMTAPGFRTEAESRYKKYIKTAYPTIDSTPGGVASRDIPRLLRSGDVRYGLPSEAEILALSTKDVKNWVTPALGRGVIEIGVVGDIDPETVIKDVARTFGALPPRETERPDYDAARKLSFPAGTAKPVTLTHNGEANRAALQIYWPAPDGSLIARTRELSVLEAVFQNRLTDVIREEEGTTYSPSSLRYTPRTYPDYGYMGVALDLEPGDVAAMSQKIDEIAADIAAGNISDDEFTRAITPILESLDDSLESNNYWMGLIDEIGSKPEDLKNHQSRAKAYQNMTVEALKPHAKAIFRPELAYRVQILPANP